MSLLLLKMKTGRKIFSILYLRQRLMQDWVRHFITFFFRSSYGIILLGYNIQFLRWSPSGGSLDFSSLKHLNLYTPHAVYSSLNKGLGTHRWISYVCWKFCLAIFFLVSFHCWECRGFHSTLFFPISLFRIGKNQPS